MAKKWKDKLKNVYDNFDEFEVYAEIYSLHIRLGYSTPKEAWNANPTVTGSTNPADYKKVN